MEAVGYEVRIRVAGWPVRVVGQCGAGGDKAVRRAAARAFAHSGKLVLTSVRMTIDTASRGRPPRFNRAGGKS